jgi:hypothetical protein
MRLKRWMTSWPFISCCPPIATSHPTRRHFRLIKFVNCAIRSMKRLHHLSCCSLRLDNAPRLLTLRRHLHRRNRCAWRILGALCCEACWINRRFGCAPIAAPNARTRIEGSSGRFTVMVGCASRRLDRVSVSRPGPSGAQATGERLHAGACAPISARNASACCAPTPSPHASKRATIRQ